jgi:hypothetical protein
MPRKPRPLDRDLGVVRDASLIVIASEDTHAVESYFARFQPRRVQFKVLPTEEGHSSPQHIVDRLDKFRKEFYLDAGDQLWYCGDTDHWVRANHLPNLLQVMAHCNQAGYHVALSNPCFELWLLLHFVDFPGHLNTCADLCRWLSQNAQGYSKDRGCQAVLTAEMISQAAERAAAMDTDANQIPEIITTRIYRILALLIGRESIVIG